MRARLRYKLTKYLAGHSFMANGLFSIVLVLRSCGGSNCRCFFLSPPSFFTSYVTHLVASKMWIYQTDVHIRPVSSSSRRRRLPHDFGKCALHDQIERNLKSSTSPPLSSCHALLRHRRNSNFVSSVEINCVQYLVRHRRDDDDGGGGAKGLNGRRTVCKWLCRRFAIAVGQEYGFVIKTKSKLIDFFSSGLVGWRSLEIG